MESQVAKGVPTNLLGSRNSALKKQEVPLSQGRRHLLESRPWCVPTSTKVLLSRALLSLLGGGRGILKCSWGLYIKNQNTRTYIYICLQIHVHCFYLSIHLFVYLQRDTEVHTFFAELPRLPLFQKQASARRRPYNHACRRRFRILGRHLRILCVFFLAKAEALWL